jgi:hypothetical protein
MTSIMSKVVSGLHQHLPEGFSWLHQQAIFSPKMSFSRSLRKQRERVQGALLVSRRDRGAGVRNGKKKKHRKKTQNKERAEPTSGIAIHCEHTA